MKREYLNFDLQIRTGAVRQYEVVARSLEGGVSGQQVYLAYDRAPLGSQLNSFHIALQKRADDMEVAGRALGNMLSEAIMTEEVRRLYDRTIATARANMKGVRWRLEMPPELALLPWEHLCYPKDRHVGLAVETPIVRYLDVNNPIKTIEVSPPLRILALDTRPIDLPELNIEQEKRNLKRAVKKLQRYGLARVVWRKCNSHQDLQRALRNGPWHILHYVGHGERGELFLTNEKEPAGKLAELLANHSDLRLVWLNTCKGADASANDIFSGVAATLIKEAGIPAVIAMQSRITDHVAVDLSRTFYEAIADGYPIDAALTEARAAVSKTAEWGVPVLYLRTDNSALLDLSQASVSQEQPSQQIRPISTDHPSSLVEQQKLSGTTRTHTTRTNFSIESFEPETVLIPKGKFTMGDSESAQGADSQWRAHKVELPEYRIGVYPVSNREYALFVDMTSHRPPQSADWYGRTPLEAKMDQPVVGVSWYDALAYCQWLFERTKTKRRYCLPSEAQWEKAARGTKGRRYPWGNQWDATRCNCSGTGTTCISQYKNGVSPYKCYDMLGNVWEWTTTIWGREWRKAKFTYPYRLDDQRDDIHASKEFYRIRRGGSFKSDHDDLTCMMRSLIAPDHIDSTIGFRVALEIPS